MLTKKQITNLGSLAAKIRLDALSMVCRVHTSHIGSAYSIVELLVYLYEKGLRRKGKNKNLHDRFILSKGWGCSTLYAILAHEGIIKKSLLKEYCGNGSLLSGTASQNGLPGIEATTGSMGHGLPIAVGMALAAKMKQIKQRIVVVMGDGELNEGSVWEGLLQAAHHKLDNLTVIIDRNGWQSFGRTKDILDPEPLTDKFKAFGYGVSMIDGHDFAAIDTAFLKQKKNMPNIIIAKTIKGKGVSLFEDNNAWHYKTPNAQEEIQARSELLKHI